MPTAAKLVAGALVALLGWYVAHQVVPHLPPETGVGWFREISAGLGLLIGWRFLGGRAGGGIAQTLGLGIGAAAFLAFWMLVVFSGVEMVRRAMRMAYGGDPFAAIKAMIEIAIGYLQYLAPNEVWVTLVLGGAIIGVIVELVARRWP